jgi:hypothetical protein
MGSAAGIVQNIKRGKGGQHPARKNCECANLVCLNRMVHPKLVCRKCAVRFEPLCANMAFFDTSYKCFRAGLVWR